MIYKITKKGNLIEIRESLKEWLFVEVSEENIIPRFYLPVERNYTKRTVICWIMPLAPFVLLFVMFRNMLWKVWVDVFETINLWKEVTRKQLKVNEKQYENTRNF